MKLYQTTIYIDTSKVLGLDVAQNDLDKADFEDNHKAQATRVTEVRLDETSIIELTFAQFKTKIISPIAWVNVQYIENGNKYVLNLIDPEEAKPLLLGKVELETIDPEEGLPFQKISYASELKNIQKGGTSKVIIRPRVLIENMLDETNVVQTLGGAVTDVGQVFKLTNVITNLDRIHLSLEALAGGAVLSVDDFESYADTAALRAVWIPSDITNTPNNLETGIVQEGTKSMQIDVLAAQKSKNDINQRTYVTPQDWSGFDGIQFPFRKDGDVTIELHIEDSNGDGIKHTLTTSANNVFEFIKLDFADFLPIGAVVADLAIVKKIGFFVKSSKVAPVYIDAIELFTSSSFGTVDVELHDFGTDPSPTTLGTPVKTEIINLQSGKQIYEIPFSASGLTPNNYYGIVLTNPSASTVKVYGKNGSDSYQNGFSFESFDELNIVTTGGGDDLYFATFALDKATFNGIRFIANADAGLGSINAFINDNASGKGKSALFLGEKFNGRKELDFPTKTQTFGNVKMGTNELVDVRIEDDSSSLVTKIQATVYFTFINRELHG